MRYKWLILILILLVYSCGKEELPKGILPKNKMVPILVDQHLAEVIFTMRFAVGVKGDNPMDDLYLSILKKHKVDQKVFEESVYYYSKHPNLYIPVYDEVLNRLNEMQVNVKLEDASIKRK
jgi:hypothetical protein